MKDMSQDMQIGKVEQSFRRGLKTYHRSATQQAQIAARLAELLAQHVHQNLDRVLEFGMGTGHLTQQLQDTFDIEQLIVNDLVRDCASFAPHDATFQGGPIEELVLPEELDLICSASTVQWIEDLPTTLGRFANALKSGGWIALSGFGHQQFQELRALGSTAAAPNYLDADDWQSALPKSLKIQHVSQKQSVEWFPDALTLLKHLRDTGVNGGSTSAWTSKDLQAFEADYKARFGSSKGLPLTYDPVWILAQKI